MILILREVSFLDRSFQRLWFGTISRHGQPLSCKNSRSHLTSTSKRWKSQRECREGRQTQPAKPYSTADRGTFSPAVEEEGTLQFHRPLLHSSPSSSLLCPHSCSAHLQYSGHHHSINLRSDQDFPELSSLQRLPSSS